MVRPDFTFIFNFKTAFVGNTVLNSKIKVNSGLNKITITYFFANPGISSTQIDEKYAPDPMGGVPGPEICKECKIL